MYLYESLGPERFQEFCQALLVLTFSDLQCFPVGQPDGGRDALSRLGRNKLGATVGQVKFKREDESANADWMISALEGELPKIRQLAELGAQHYIMMTNARGTAHPGSGRIDSVQEWLDLHSPIPAMVLWRDDLDRRLDGAPAVKLRYPGVMTGEDVLAVLVEAQLGSGQARIGRALKAFAAEQFHQDEQVKFRQVDLANNLLDLFVDVPLDAEPFLWSSQKGKVSRDLREVVTSMVIDNAARHSFDPDGGRRSGDPHIVGAADVLLNDTVQTEAPWILLHGAPGQGKSTIGQYVAQVHRARYLNRNPFLGQIKREHAESAFRFPIKVDLRDFAAYLDGRSYLGQANRDREVNRTLERFLASLISIGSGGLDFSPDDLAATLTSTPALFVLDGLDEVADLESRSSVVERINDGLFRLKELGANVQVILTSRPSHLGKSTVVPRRFVRVELAPIDSLTIHAYARKWTAAKGLPEARAREVREILTQKQALPHIAELTKNPMQLTILLSLIHSKGHSLPNARTDLYREYVNLFMTREAEKSPVVREHQSLLLAIVEYLAWQLQSEAEADGNAGSISHDEVREVIASYLREAEQDLDIIDDLFTGGLERVYVLVQRVEGLYEFEVQPLREYFAAKYLYSSAPVRSFRVDWVPGDRAQRFEAIASNPYWANVTRFFAGFYEDGELGALSTSLREMMSKSDIGETLNARVIGAALLTDWVFSNKKPIQKEVVQLVFDPIGVKLAAYSLLAGFDGELDRACGRDTLASIIFDTIQRQHGQVELALCQLLSRNGGSGFGDRFVQWCEEVTGSQRTARLRVALASGAFELTDVDVVEVLLFGDGASDYQMRRRLVGVIKYDESLTRRSAKIAEESLRSVYEWGGVRFASSLTSIGILASQFSDTPFPSWPIINIPAKKDDALLEAGKLKKARAVAKLLAQEEWDEERWDAPEEWDERIEAIRRRVGNIWALYSLAAANIGGMAQSRARQIRDDPKSILSLAQRGRNYRGDGKWWADQIGQSAGDERLFWICLLLAWAPSRVVSQHITLLDSELAALGERDFERIVFTLTDSMKKRQSRGGRLREPVQISANISDQLLIALVSAFGDRQLAEMPREVQLPKRVKDEVNRSEQIKVIRTFPGWSGLTDADTRNWLVKFAEMRWLGGLARAEVDVSAIPLKVANEVLREFDLYPIQLIRDVTTSLQAAYRPARVRDVAKGEQWVFE